MEGNKNFMLLNLQFFADDDAVVEDTSSDSNDNSEVAELGGAEQTESLEQPESEKEDEQLDDGEDSREEKPKQSSEENAKFAAARRRAEAEWKAKLEARDKQFEERFRGYTNPITGAPIKSEQDYFDAMDAQEQLTMQEQLKQANLDPNVINQYINNNPAVKQAQQILEQHRKAEFERRLTEDIGAIGKIDPSIKSIDDFLKSDRHEAVLSTCKEKNMTLSEAYEWVHRDDIYEKKVAAAKQAAINQAKGKSHLESVNGVSDAKELADVPPSTMQRLRDFYPDLSDLEIQKKYNNIL